MICAMTRLAMIGAVMLVATSAVDASAAPPTLGKPAAAQSPYQGSYSGWFYAPGHASWSLEIDIGSSGRISGSAAYARYDEYNPGPVYTATGSARGSVGSGGSFELRLSAGTVRETYAGQASLD